jgi:hypothetical protein
MTLFRGLWVDSEELNMYESNIAILPSGVSTVAELDLIVAAAINNFGSLRLAALHHLTGATGIRANEPGKPVFTFWSRQKSVALEHLHRTFGQYDGKNVPILLEAEIENGDRVVIAADEGLYQERLSDALEDTFAEFAPEDEVFVSIPVIRYSYSVVNISFPTNDARRWSN